MRTQKSGPDEKCYIFGHIFVTKMRTEKSGLIEKSCKQLFLKLCNETRVRKFKSGFKESKNKPIMQM